MIRKTSCVEKPGRCGQPTCPINFRSDHGGQVNARWACMRRILTAEDAGDAEVRQRRLCRSEPGLPSSLA